MRSFLITIMLGCLSTFADAKAKPRLYALDIKSLEKNKARIQAKDATLMPAYKLLLKDADKALDFGPVSVMEKKHLPPSGDKHDYMSLAPYHWPDPSKPNGLPYMRKDGQTNPEVLEYKDKEYLPKLCEFIQTLSLAYYFSDDHKYAAHASKLIQVWFLDDATKMNPNLNFAQAIKGENTGRGAGLIDARHLITVVDAVNILNTSQYFSNKHVAGMKTWFRDFLNWMQISPIGLDEMDADNNHGAWYDAQRLTYALFIDSVPLAKKIIANAQARLDKQMDDEGKFPKEMERTIALHYSTFVMNAFFTIATLAESIGMDIWSLKSSSGKSLAKGFAFLHPFLNGSKHWQGQQIKEFDTESAYPLLAAATYHLGCRKCFEEIKMLAGDKADRLRLNLLY